MKIVTGRYIYRTVLAFVSVMIILWVPVIGQVPITSATYFQNFNELANSGTGSTCLLYTSDAADE